MRAFVRQFVAVAILVLAPQLAKATCTSNFGKNTATNVEVCINYTPNFADINGGEDFWTTNTARSAQGIRIKILRTLSPFTVLWGGTDGDYVGPDGCITLAGPFTAGPYTIRAYSQAKIVEGGLYLYVDGRADESNDDRYYINLSTNFSPTSNITCTSTWNNSSGGSIEGGGGGDTSDVVNILAGVSFTLGQHEGGLGSGRTFKVFNDECLGSGSGSCTVDGADNDRVDIYLSNTGRANKFIVAHEVGHGVQFQRDEEEVAQNSSSESSDPCDRDDGPSGDTPHTLVSKESQGMAATEGFAHFWSAATWNSSGGDDCAFKYYKHVDLDQDGTLETFENDAWISCVDSAHPASYPDYDYLHAKCGSGFSGRATEFDWLRALFNAYIADDDLTTGDIVQIWDDANPHTWDPDEASPGSDSPYERLSDAANGLLDYDHEVVWYWNTSLHGTDE